CGFRFEAGGIPAYAFPGVPFELEVMVKAHLLPLLAGDCVLLEKTLWTWGWSEGAQNQALSGLALPASFRYSSLPGQRGVRLTVSCLCPPSERDAHAAELDVFWRSMIAAVPPEAIVDSEGATLPEAVQKRLAAQAATVSVAESCTGGGLGFLLTESPGSSEFFRQGFLTYSNQAKIELLGLAPDLLERH